MKIKSLSLSLLLFCLGSACDTEVASVDEPAGDENADSTAEDDSVDTANDDDTIDDGGIDAGSVDAGEEPVDGGDNGGEDDEPDGGSDDTTQIDLQSTCVLAGAGTLVAVVETISIDGEITLNGATLPDDDIVDEWGRGELRFVDEMTKRIYPVELPATGPALYQTALPSGRYRVELFGETYPVSGIIAPRWGVVLAEGVDLRTSSTHDFDARTVTISGELLLNGATAPDDTILDENSRGTIIFEDAKHATNGPFNISDGFNYKMDIGEVGAADFEVEVFAGTYDVLFSPRDEDDQDVFPRVGWERVLSKELVLEEDSDLSWNLDVVTLNGEVTLNGATMPDDADPNETTDRAYLRFDTDEGTISYVGLGLAGPATYSFTAYAGTYRVELVDKQQSSHSVLPPYRGAVLAQALLLDEDTDLDFNAETFTLSGEVLLNDSTFPENGEGAVDREPLTINNIDVDTPGFASDVDISSSGPATFSKVLLAGTYQIDMGTTRLHEGVELNDDLHVTLNATTHIVDGTFSINGEPFVEQGQGQVRFVRGGNHFGAYAQWDPDTAGAFSLMTTTDTFDVVWDPISGEGPYPRHRKLLQADLVVDDDVVVNYAISFGEVDVEVRDLDALAAHFDDVDWQLELVALDTGIQGYEATEQSLSVISSQTFTVVMNDGEYLAELVGVHDDETIVRTRLGLICPAP